MFGGCLQKFNKNTVAASDVVPDAVNWSDVTYDEGLITTTYTKQQITGISSSITLKVSLNNTNVKCWYKVTTANDTYSSGLPSGNSFTQITNNQTFSVNNNQYVHFSVTDNGNIAPQSTTATVKNNSDGDTSLDTFVLNHILGI